MGSIVNYRSYNSFELDAIQFFSEHGIDNPRELLKMVKSTEYGYDKLRRLMEGDIVMKDVDGTEDYFGQCFKEFICKAPQWSNEHAKSHSETLHLFFEGFTAEERKTLMIIRQQNSGVCYLHAVVVFEHYLSAIMSGGKVVSTYDVGKYEGHTLSGKLLENFLLRNEGGNALETLRSLWIMGPEDLLIQSIPSCKSAVPQSYALICEDILNRTKTQPALVSNIKIKDILESADVKFTEAPRGIPERPRHAMVLIGARKTKDGEYFFLLQNWWKSRFFIEVSGDYLSHCDAKITFFLGTKIERREDFEDFLYQATFAETSADACETSPPEL